MRRTTLAGVLTAVLLACMWAPGASARPAKAAATELTIWDWNYFANDNKKALDAIDKAFMKANPAIKIKHVGIPFNTAYAKIRTAVAARKGPDIVTLYPGTFAADYRRGLVPLNSRITARMRNEVPMLRSSAAPDGNIYAVPFSAYGYIWAYNKKLFAKAGLDPAHPPATWAEFLAACAKLRAAGIDPMAAGWKDGYLLEWFLYVYGDQLLTKAEAKKWATGDLPVNNPKFVKALQFALDLNAKDYFEKGAEGKVVFNDMNDGFSSGKSAMLLWYGGAGDFKKWEDGLGAANVGLFLPPRLPGSPYARVMDAGPNGGYAITNWGKHQDEAWKYLAFTQTKAAQLLNWKIGSRLPNNRAVKVDSSSAVTDKMLEFLRIPDNYTIYTGFPASVISILDRQAAAVVAGSLSPKALLDQMEAAMARLRPGLKKS